MLFNSELFIFVFVPLTTAAYFIARKYIGYDFALLLLTIASVIFYAYWDVYLTWRIFASMIGNFAFGTWIQKHPPGSFMRKSLFIFAIFLNLLALAYFKYMNFFIDNLNYWRLTDIHINKIILPLGISFFTFNEIAYLVDSYRDQTREYKFIRYCLFVTYFPHLIAGPIIHHKQIMGEFARAANLRLLNLSVGITIFSIGLFKKVGIADGIAQYSTPLFDAAANGTHLSLFESWCAALCYGLQLYFDFSGYSDMAVGLSRLFGIQLPINFFSPYKSRDIIQFWRRWHISLSMFLRNYLYIPLGGNRSHRYLNLMITMLLGGLWHGANWNFMIWGCLHGLFLITNKIWKSVREKSGALNRACSTPAWTVAATVITFLAVTCAWVFFRATDLSTARSILGSMAGFNGIDLPKSLEATAFALFGRDTAASFANFNGSMPNNIVNVLKISGIWIPIALFVAFVMPNTKQIMSRYKSGILLYQESQASATWLVWRPTPIWAFAIAILAFISLWIIASGTTSEFLYYQF